jgi:hypothetical protein
MADKFDYFQFKNIVNPFGILFHPLAIEKFIGFSIAGTLVAEADIFFHNERWHSFDAHSDLSNADKNQLLDNLNSAILSAGKALKSATHVIITLGTAWAYRDNVSQNLVANCHKVPQKEFSKELLSVDAIADSLKNTIALIEQANPSAVNILTVSPVRHLKDGFIENQRSKAHLIAAVHQVIDAQSKGHRPTTNDHRPTTNDPIANDQQPSTIDPITKDQQPSTIDPKPTYFPSYEITMDELRDYRFYAEDMLHPSKIAIDYIWEKFASGWISPEAIQVMDEVDAIRKALAHRPFNPDSVSHRNFLKTTSDKITALQQKFPHIVFRSSKYEK